jgi:lipoprotein NlpD
MRMRGLAPLAGAFLLVACASTTVVREDAPRQGAPTSSPSAGRHAAPAAMPPGPRHVVVAGDTLYGIAFRNSLDWRDVARWNGIDEPYVIRPGQVLRLSASRPARVTSAPVASAPAASAPAASVRGVVGAVASGPAPTPRGASPGPPSSTPAPSAGPIVPAATAPASPVPAAQPATVVAAPTSTPPSAAPAPVAATAPTGPAGTAAFRSGQWQWPTQGQIVSRYTEGDKARQGLAIAGTAGQPVRAAAAGTVVYSGAGLVGYGELIIIKHNDEWLSAYGHNRRRLVAEGAQVSAGQQIAELGRTGTSRDMLHFEIRRNGKPVDPTGLLPAH